MMMMTLTWSWIISTLLSWSTMKESLLGGYPIISSFRWSLYYGCRTSEDVTRVANKSICGSLKFMFNLWNLGFDVCEYVYELTFTRTNTKILCEFFWFFKQTNVLQIMISNNTTKFNFMQHLKHGEQYEKQKNQIFHLF